MALRKVTNEDPMNVFVGAMITGDTSGEIVAQEKRGQASFVKSDTFPVEILVYGRDSNGNPIDGKAILERWGFEFLGIVEKDPIWQYVKLPEGWVKRPTEHDMWSEILDANGVARIAIFYKAAFYDRSCHAHIEPRFGHNVNYDLREFQNIITDEVKDRREGNKVIFATDPIPFPPVGEPNRYRGQNAASDLARLWLDQHYPEWNNPGAYWD